MKNFFKTVLYMGIAAFFSVISSNAIAAPKNISERLAPPNRIVLMQDTKGLEDVMGGPVESANSTVGLISGDGVSRQPYLFELIEQEQITELNHELGIFLRKRHREPISDVGIPYYATMFGREFLRIVEIHNYYEINKHVGFKKDKTYRDTSPASRFIFDYSYADTHPVIDTSGLQSEDILRTYLLWIEDMTDEMQSFGSNKQRAFDTLFTGKPYCRSYRDLQIYSIKTRYANRCPPDFSINGKEQFEIQHAQCEIGEHIRFILESILETDVNDNSKFIDGLAALITKTGYRIREGNNNDSPRRLKYGITVLRFPYTISTQKMSGYVNFLSEDIFLGEEINLGAFFGLNKKLVLNLHTQPDFLFGTFGVEFSDVSANSASRTYFWLSPPIKDGNKVIDFRGRYVPGDIDKGIVELRVYRLF